MEVELLRGKHDFSEIISKREKHEFFVLTQKLQIISAIILARIKGAVN